MEGRGETYPKRLTSKILCQASIPFHDVPLKPIPALFMRIATWEDEVTITIVRLHVQHDADRGEEIGKSVTQIDIKSHVNVKQNKRGRERGK